MGNQLVSTTQTLTIGIPAVAVYLTRHAFTPPATGPTHIEMCTPAHWPPGVGSHKFTGTVFHQGLPIVKDGHDHGQLIPHWNVSPWPPNPLLLLIIPFSSRKVMFGASTVKMNGDPTGCNNFWVPTPMMACAQPCGFPIGYGINQWHTCLVGMTLGDWLAGAFTIAATMLVDCLTDDGGPASYADEIMGALGVPKVWDKDFWIKQGVGALTGAVKIALTGEGSIEFGVGTDKAGLKIAVKRKRKPGKEHSFTDIFDSDGWEVEHEESLANDKTGGNFDDETTETNTDWGIDGTSTTEEKKTKTYPDGSKTETITETEIDAYGRQKSRTVYENKYDKNGELIESKSSFGEVDGKGDPNSDAMNPKGDKPL